MVGAPKPNPFAINPELEEMERLAEEKRRNTIERLREMRRRDRNEPTLTDIVRFGAALGLTPPPNMSLAPGAAGNGQKNASPVNWREREAPMSYSPETLAAATKRLEGKNPSSVRKDLARGAVEADPNYFVREEDRAAGAAEAARKQIPMPPPLNAAGPFDFPVLTQTPRHASVPDMIVPTVPMGLAAARLLQAAAAPRQEPHGRFGPGFRANTQAMPQTLAPQTVAGSPPGMHPSAVGPFDWQSPLQTQRRASLPDMTVPTVPMGLPAERLVQTAATPTQEPHGRFGPGWKLSTQPNAEMIELFKTPMREHGRRVLLSLGGDNPSPKWRQTVNEIMGTEGGLYGTGIGAIDFLPFVGNAIGIEEAIRNDDPLGFLLAMLPVAKAAGAAMKGARGAAQAGRVDRVISGLFGDGAKPTPAQIEEVAKKYPTFFDAHTAHAVYEMTPGRMTRHHSKLVDAPFEERKAFTDDPLASWTDEEGRDIIYDALGIPHRPTVPATGVYQPPTGGPLENNPALVGNSLVNLVGKPGARTVDPADAELLTIAEGTRAYASGQGAGAWSMPIPNHPDLADSVRLSTRGPLTVEQIADLRSLGAGDYNAPDVLDYGTSGAIANFGGRANNSAIVNDPMLQERLRKIVPGTEAMPTQMKGEYVPYENAWINGYGSGEVTRKFENLFSGPQGQEALARLDASPKLRKKLLDLFDQSMERAKIAGDPVREDLQNARRIINEGGVSSLFQALKEGKVALPAVALILGPLLTQAEQDAQSE